MLSRNLDWATATNEQTVPFLAWKPFLYLSYDLNTQSWYCRYADVFACQKIKFVNQTIQKSQLKQTHRPTDRHDWKHETCIVRKFKIFPVNLCQNDFIHNFHLPSHLVLLYIHFVIMQLFPSIFIERTFPLDTSESTVMCSRGIF